MAKKYREIRIALKSDGWQIVRQAGSHEIWRKGAKTVTIAGKDSDSVPVGTLASIRRATGMDLALKDYLIIYEEAEDGGWGAHCADFDGVAALGSSREEVESLMQEALSAHLAFLRESELPVPEPHTDAGYIAA